MKTTFKLAAALFGCMAAGSAHAAPARPVVLELYTSQGCSSCPPADALLVELARNPQVLALSFHVDYWDNLGWPDAFSRAESTARQQQYSRWMGRNNVFTPQLVVDGTASVNGSDRAAVGRAIAAAQELPQPVVIGSQLATPGQAEFHVPARSGDDRASLYAVHYQKLATTNVARGENAGRSLTSVNNVTAITPLGAWNDAAQTYPQAVAEGEGVALLLQRDADGKILSAAAL